MDNPIFELIFCYYLEKNSRFCTMCSKTDYLLMANLCSQDGYGRIILRFLNHFDDFPVRRKNIKRPFFPPPVIYNWIICLVNTSLLLLIPKTCHITSYSWITQDLNQELSVSVLIGHCDLN